MPCCGQKRATMTTQSVRTRTAPGNPSIHTPDPPRRRVPEPSAPAMLRYTKAGTIALRGPYSGRVYLFSNREASAVLAEDVDVLLRTGVLERAGA